MSLSIKPLGKAGDTIVEVLIAVVVVSSVLTGAFTISNMSLKSIRMSQERSEAQKLAQQAIESFNSLLPSNGASTILNAPFCIKTTPPTTSLIAFAESDCRDTPNGRYITKIERVGVTGTFTYKVTVNWDGLNGTNQEVIFYFKAAS